MAEINGFNGDDKKLQGNKPRIEKKTEKWGKTTIITESVFNQSKNGKFEYLSEEKVLFDYNGDGVIDKIFTKKFDKDANLVEQSTDKDGDGKADEIVKYEYDAKGNETKIIVDYDGDGKVDGTITRKYDAKGEEETLFDYNADGKVDEKRLYENGKVKKVWVDKDGDGKVDEKYVYENGEAKEKYVDTNPKNKVYEEHYVKDRNGNLKKDKSYRPKS